VSAEPSSASRSARRFALARLAVAFGGLDKAVGTLASLLRVPLLIWALTLEQYGLYVAILGVVATANLLDFGLSYGVLNAVADARGRDDRASISGIVATAFVLYTGIVAAAFALLGPLLLLLPLDRILGAASGQSDLVRQVALLGFASFVLPLPLKVFSAGLQGFQQQYAVSAFRSLSSFAELALLAAVAVVFRGRLVPVVLVVLATEILRWSLFAWYAAWRQPELRLRLGSASRALAPGLAAAGVVFLVTNLANTLKLTLGSTVVSHGLGPASVPAFSVPLALFVAAFGLALVSAQSFWPAYGEAAARGDWDWVQRAFVLGSKMAVGVAGAFAVPGCLFGTALIDVWMPKSIAVSQTLLLLLAVWLVAETCFNATASLLSGLQKIRIVMWVALAEGVLVLASSLWLVERLGVAAVGGSMALWGSLGALALCAATAPATAGRLRFAWGPLARVLACIVVSAGVGLALRQALAGSSALATLALGGGLTLGAYALAAWWLVLTPLERARVWGFARRRLAARGAAPGPS
jgi:O-antigen/teichoic acid export membrane protein